MNDTNFISSLTGYDFKKVKPRMIQQVTEMREHVNQAANQSSVARELNRWIIDWLVAADSAIK